MSLTRHQTRRMPNFLAFTEMRVGEVLQLSASDVRQEGGLWFLTVHEDDAAKSVKIGQHWNIPIHDALIREGLLSYAHGLPPDGPLFPEKAVDVHGHRGRRGCIKRHQEPIQGRH